jgi:hypothetical protein
VKPVPSVKVLPKKVVVAPKPKKI